jgi:RNA-directed DNA polymerase
MKRTGNLFEAIADWNNLRVAVLKALCGKRKKVDALHFVGDLDANLKLLRQRLVTESMPLGRFHQFTIHDPKKRLITAPCFEERVLHHAVMNVCEAIFERLLIFDTYACRRGKGRVACLLRAQQFARRHPFFLKFDIRKYFDSVDHDVLKTKLGRHFKDHALLRLFGRIIDSYAVAPGKGVPIGSLTSQHFANFYLGSCDRFVKQTLRAPGYVRYMDDMLVWDSSTAALKSNMARIQEFLHDQLKLTVKPQAYINRTARGCDFLGCRVYPSHQTLNQASRRRFCRALRWLNSAVQRGQISEREAQQRGTAVIAFTRTPGMKCWRFRGRVLNQLW